MDMQATETNEESIAELVEQSGRAAVIGDAAGAELSLARARQIDPVGFELELARRAWANESGDAESVRRRRVNIIRRLGGVAVAAPDRGECWLQLAEFLRQVEDHNGVLRATAGGLKRDPVNVDLWLLRVRAQIDLGQWASAARSLRHTCLLAPTHDAIEALVRTHPLCARCGSLLPDSGAERCAHCGADGPGLGALVRSVRARHQSKFDIYFPRVRDVLAEALDMPEHIKRRLTLDTLLKRHLKRTNQQCARVLRAMGNEFGEAFDEELFQSAVIGYLDLLISDLIRAIDPSKDQTLNSADRRRAVYGTGI
jgi:ribosomal protein L37E